MRKTSDVTDVGFPFTDDRVPFILIVTGDNLVDGHTKDGRGFEHASTFDKKRALIEQAIQLSGVEGGDCSLLAAWPGAKRTDVFLVDNYDEALAAFG
jgi:hypothetical protein